MRSNIRNYREALDEASKSDGQLYTKVRQNESDFEDMRNAALSGEVDELFRKAVLSSTARGKSYGSGTPTGGEPNLLDADFGEDGLSVAEQISIVEDILKKLNLVKRERNQVLKDLKDKVR